MASYNGDDTDNFNVVSFANYYGGDGNDFIGGRVAGEQFSGGAGNDILFGGFPTNNTGDGFTAATAALYTAFAPSGDDFFEGGTGNDGIYGADGNDAIFGGDGDDGGVIQGFNGTFFHGGLRGGDGNDIIDGGRGNDDVYGENGNDDLAGGDGADKFFFTTAPNAATNLDIVRDFEKGVDDIVLSQAIFTDIGPTLEKKEFYVGKKAHDNNDRVGYNPNNGKVWTDHDGKGGDQKVFFADLDSHLKLKFTDFEMIA